MILCPSRMPNVRVDQTGVRQIDILQLSSCSSQVHMSGWHRMSAIPATMARPVCAAAACWFAYQPIVEPLVEFAEEDGEQLRNLSARLLRRLQPNGSEWNLVRLQACLKSSMADVCLINKGFCSRVAEGSQVGYGCISRWQIYGDFPQRPVSLCSAGYTALRNCYSPCSFIDQIDSNFFVQSLRNNLS
jgi:hypothetical protein